MVYAPRAASVAYENENEIEPSQQYARNAKSAVGKPALTYKIADIRNAGTPDPRMLLRSDLSR
jgi:hypothetical protein